MRKGLTMIEMLVVIGIIGILTAVMLGTFSGSTESARAAKCMANMRNLAMAVQSFGMAHEYYPFAGTVTWTESKDGNTVRVVYGQGWVGWPTPDPKDAGGSYCSPYTKNSEERYLSLSNGCLFASLRGGTGSYVCPNHRRTCSDKRVKEPVWSYAMNACFGWNNLNDPDYWEYGKLSRSESRLLFAELPFAAAKTKKGTVIQEGVSSSKTSASAENDPVLHYDGSGGGTEAIGFNHKDGKETIAHVCFADGHMQKLRMPANFSPTQAKELTKWLCVPYDDDGKAFDISFDGQKYRRDQTTAAQ